MDLKAIDPKNVNVTIGGKFKLKELIGKGSFGQIYSASVKGTDAEVAVKLEKKQANTYVSLSKEARIISELNGDQGFPNLYAYGKEESFNFMATTLLGYNIEKFLRTCGGKFPMKTTLMLADQILTRIETFHSHGYVHRDIKPENFVMGRGVTQNNLFMIDFGLARAFQDLNGKHVAFKEKNGLVGTARYASLNAHNGYEQSRRDDLESIGYVLIYFAKGKLPWQNIKASTKEEKYKLIADVKLNTTADVLCKDLPTEFATYMNHVRNLGFEETPNYKSLRKLFRMLFLESGFDYDYHYGWIRKISTITPSKSSKTSKFKLESIDAKGFAESSRKKERLITFAKPNKFAAFSKIDSVVEEEKLEDSYINVDKPETPSKQPYFPPVQPTAPESNAPIDKGDASPLIDRKSRNSSVNTSKDLNISVHNKQVKLNDEEEIPIELDSYVSPSKNIQESNKNLCGITFSPEIKRRFYDDSGSKKDSFKKQLSSLVTRPTLIDENSVRNNLSHRSRTLKSNKVEQTSGSTLR